MSIYIRLSYIIGSLKLYVVFSIIFTSILEG
jgi:hypothetical protein